MDPAATTEAAAVAGESGDLALGLTASAVIFALYLLPTLVAFLRKHHNKAQILLLNLFLGWTFLGWIGALIWSVGTVKRPAAASLS